MRSPAFIELKTLRLSKGASGTLKFNPIRWNSQRSFIKKRFISWNSQGWQSVFHWDLHVNGCPL